MVIIWLFLMRNSIYFQKEQTSLFKKNQSTIIMDITLSLIRICSFMVQVSNIVHGIMGYVLEALEFVMYKHLGIRGIRYYKLLLDEDVILFL